MSTDCTGGEGTFKYAESVAAERMGMTTAELNQYMSDNELTWHECADRHTIRAIPTRINAAFKHSGGISMQKSVESMATTLSEQHDGASFSLQRESKLGYADVKRHCETNRKHAQSTGRRIYTLRTGKIIAKAKAAEWAVENNLCSDLYALQTALHVRRNPLKYRDDIHFLLYLRPDFLIGFQDSPFKVYAVSV